MGRRREKERSHVISEGKSNQTPGSLTFNTVDFFFCLMWEDEEKFNLRKTRGGGEPKTFTGFC